MLPGTGDPRKVWCDPDIEREYVIGDQAAIFGSHMAVHPVDPVRGGIHERDACNPRETPEIDMHLGMAVEPGNMTRKHA